MPPPIEVIINAASGTRDKQQVKQTVAAVCGSEGVEARIHLGRSGAEVVELARRAAAGDSRIVVAAGGDGTLAAVAHELAGTGKTFGVLPLGTFNYFARNLGIPLDLEGAVHNLLDGNAIELDVAEVNGRTFLINASLGLYPSLLRQREKVYRRWGRSRLAAYFSAALTMLRPSAFLNLCLKSGRRQLRQRTPLVFVGRNRYQLDEFNIAGRACVDEGAMAFYIVDPVGRIGLIRLAVRRLLRQPGTQPGFHVLCLKEARVESRRKRLRVAMDGEIVVMRPPLRFRMHPRALRVIVPAREVGGREGTKL